MKISYSVLWFDDTDDYFESLDLDETKDVIKSWGFCPEIKLVTNPEKFMLYEPFREFDLIVVDYNLEEYDKHGQEFIKKIRDHDVYTEVIFYSANPARELWDAVRDKELEGVFVTNRQGVQTKILKVAEQSVRKILDLENVRGIVMAEVGNIDKQLENIINVTFNSISDEDKEKLLTKYIDRIKEQHQTCIEDVALANDEKSISLLLSFCDSNKKWNLFQSLSKKQPLIDLKQLGDYAQEVLMPRNFLAHGIPEKTDDGSLIFRHNGKEYVFDDDVSAELRQSIQNFSEKFDKISKQAVA